MQASMSQMLAKSLGVEGAQQATCRRTQGFPLSEPLRTSCRNVSAAQYSCTVRSLQPPVTP